MNSLFWCKLRFFLLSQIVVIILLISPALAQTHPSIKIDGSSTVYPITKAVADAFNKTSPDVEISVVFSGTGGGFKEFCSGRTDISDASRPIKSKEKEFCANNNIEYIELPVGFDGIAVVVNPENDWLKDITISELKKIWQPEAQDQVTQWNQVREQWPAAPLNLFGPGIDSGTYDYFIEAIVGGHKGSRADYISSEDDGFLVDGVAKDKFALGFFGLSYYVKNKDKLKVIAIDNENGKGPVLPAESTIHSGEYAPLSRPIFIYVKKEAVQRPEVDAFIQFYLTHAAKFVQDAGYVPLSEEAYRLIRERYTQRKTGSIFKGDDVGVSLKDILKAYSVTP